MVALLRYAFVLCTLTLVALATGCDGDGDGQVRADDECTNDTTREAMRALDATRITDHAFERFDPRANDDEATCRARRALLTIADLPEGWERQNSSSLDRFGQLPACGLVSTPALIASVAVGFTEDGDAPLADFDFLEQAVYGFKPGYAARALEAARRLCMAQHDQRGQYSEVAFDATKGEGMLAFTHRTGEDSEWSARRIFIRTGDTILAFSALANTSLDLGALTNKVLKESASIGPYPSDAAVLTQDACRLGPASETSEFVQRVSAALLTIDDVAPGYVSDPLEPCGVVAEESGCHSPKALASIGIHLEKRFGGVSHSIDVFPRGESEEVLSRLVQAASQELECRHSLSDGTVILTRYLPVPGEPFGPDVGVIRYKQGEQYQSQGNYVAVAFAMDAAIVSIAIEDVQASTYRPAPITGSVPLSQTQIDELTPLIETARRKLEAVQAQLN
ncbi:MAG: hypothetical protein WEB52_05160 [Dehalococcoidia bacterium]